MTLSNRARNLLTGIAKVSLVLLLFVALGLALDVLMHLPGLPLGDARWTGFLVLGLGLYLETRATRAFWLLGEGTPNPVDPPTRLVDRGPYKYTRNPLYLARMGILLGFSLLLASTGVLLLSLGLFLFLQFSLVPEEERRLREKFGHPYEAYCERVPRWVLPGAFRRGGEISTGTQPPGRER